MSLKAYFILAIVFIFCTNFVFSKIYPPQQQLVYHSGTLSCTVEETTAPSPGGSDGVATVDLLASPDRNGYGKDATGGTNYVYVTNYNQLKNALQTAGNYVLLDPFLSGQGIGFPNSINPASNTTLDGSLAPGCWFYPNYGVGYPANTPMINFFSTNNCIIHSVEMRGNRATPYKVILQPMLEHSMCEVHWSGSIM